MPRHTTTDYQLRQLTVEYRYDSAYHIWDRSGKIWARVREKLGALEHQTVQPSNTVFHAQGRYGLSLGLDKTFIIDHQPPRSIDEDARAKIDFLSVVLEELEIAVLTRVGTRVQFVRTFSSIAEAAAAARAYNLVKEPEQRLFDVAPGLIKPTFQIEMSDDEIAFNARIQPITKTLKFTAPPEARGLDSQSIIEQQLQVDIDFYTEKSTPVAGFDLSNWLEKWRRVLNRDLEALLNLAESKS